MKYKSVAILFVALILIILSCSDKGPYQDWLTDYLFDDQTGRETGTVTDIDGNVYQTVKFGDQWWMAENLKVTLYRNGDPIPNVTDYSTWYYLSTGAYCNYDNNEDNVAVYGRLYNWYAVEDSRNIAPEGWHVPSDDEWKQLEMYLGMSQAEADNTWLRGTDEGGKLKESVFFALPGGKRDFGNYSFLGYHAYLWSSTKYSSYYNSVWYRGLSCYNSKVERSYYNKREGLSVRCVKD